MADSINSGDKIAVHRFGSQRQHVMVQTNGFQKVLEIVGCNILSAGDVEMREDGMKTRWW